MISSPCVIVEARSWRSRKRIARRSTMRLGCHIRETANYFIFQIAFISYHYAMRSLVLAMAILAALTAMTQCQERRLVLRPSAPMPAVLIP